MHTVTTLQQDKETATKRSINLIGSNCGDDDHMIKKLLMEEHDRWLEY